MGRVYTSLQARAWGSAQASRLVLAEIEFTNPSALTLRFSDQAGAYFQNYLWQKAITGLVSVTERSPFLSPGPDLATAELSLESRYVDDAAAELNTSLATLQWQGATVTLYRMVRDLSTPFAWFTGRVNRPVLDEDGTIKLPLMQGRVWNRRLPTTALDKINYPNAPDIGSGQVIPVVYGEFGALPMRSPWAAAYTYRYFFERLGQGCGAVPGVIVDPGLGSADVQVKFASHELKQMGGGSGISDFIVGGNQLDPLDTAALTYTFADGLVEIADDGLVAYHGVLPTDVYSAASTASPNTATDPRKCMEIFDETTYTTIDQNTAASLLFLVLPQPSMLGNAEQIEIAVAYSGDAGNTHNLRVFAMDPNTLTTGTLHSFAATSATPGIQSFSDFTGVLHNWQVAGDGTNIYGLASNFAGGTVNQARLYAFGLIFKYRPQRSLVTPGAVFIGGTYVPPADYGPNTDALFAGATAPQARVRQPQFRVSGQFYSHVQGQPDSGGTYTGSGTSLIQRPPDITHHMLVTYGGLSSSDIETGSTAFGSFVRARSFLRGGSASDYVLACHIGQKSSVQAVMQKIAQQSLSLVYFCALESKWKWITWDADKPVDYDVVLHRSDVIGKIRQEPYSDVGVRQSITVPWYYDHFRNRSMFEAKVGPEISTRGYNQPTYQDQQAFIVDATNDDIDWTSGGVNQTDSLTHGTYDHPMDLATEVRTQMRTADADFHTGWGFSIRQSHAYIIAITVSAVDYDAELNDGDYGPETLAAEAQRALNAEGHGLTFTVTYSHTTNKFTIAASGTFTIRAQGAHHMGFVQAQTGTSLVANYARYAETFWFGAFSPDFAFRWASGANTATGAHRLLGFDVADSATGEDLNASYRRNNRETLAAESAADWGELEELTLPSEYIRQEETAVLYRDRNADLRRQPRMRIEFDTMRMPDAQRGRVFETDGDLDDLHPFTRYGSDGSWEGKKFMVIEKVSRGGTSWHDTIVAVEVVQA